jgi:hypothetical protein
MADDTILLEIENFAPAKTRKDVKRLCGFLNWFRPFVTNFAN